MNHGATIRAKAHALLLIWFGVVLTVRGQTPGTVVAWGDNSAGQSSVPAGLTNVVAISAGYGYSLALRADGSASGWGNQPAPIPNGLTNCTAIASGVIFSLALKSDGTVAAWGDDTYGQIDVPAGLSNVVAIADGVEQGLAIKNDGSVIAWGYVTNVPPAPGNVLAVVGENYQNLALLNDGTVLSMGGFGTSTGLNNVVAIAAEYYASEALTADGQVYRWDQSTPVNQASPVDGFTNIVAIAAFYDHFLALKNDGTVMVSGSDTFGGTAVPAGLSGVIGIATGGQHGLALLGNGAVTIVQQPMPRTLYSGVDATFSVGAIGTPPLSYQWQFGGTNLPGATNSVLTISNAQPADAGVYRVVVTGPASSATSTGAALNLQLTPPIITQQPVGENGWLGGVATFNVVATGSQPVAYQWQFNGTNLDGATNDFLNLTNLQTGNQGFYSVVASNGYGTTNSSSAFLEVQGLAEALNATNLVWQTGGDIPWVVDVSNWAHDGVAAAVGSVPLPGQQSILQTTVSGPGTLTYWWQVLTPVYGINLSLSVNGTVQPFASPGYTWQQQTCYLGAGTNLLQWIYANSGPYVDGDVSSWLDQVSYLPGGTAPIIATAPGSQTQPAGTNVTFSVAANGTAPFSYQWAFNGAALAGATNASYRFYLASTNQAGGYSVIITNNYGSITSSAANLTVLVAAPTIAAQPASQTVPGGSNATFNVMAYGSPPLNYQWLFNRTPLDGQTNAGLALASITTDQAGVYSVLVTSPYGSITSHVATLVVSGLPVITQQPTNQSVLAGNRALLTAGVAGVGPLSFQWQLNGTNLTNGFMTTIAGNGSRGYAGDGGIATTGMMTYPHGLVADSAGNVFFADSSNNRIRRVSTNGVMTTVAGKGSAIYAGDGGAATNAYLNGCNGVTLDGQGNLFIADTYNNRIRKVDTNGIITTVAGKSSAGFSGDGGAATNASLYNPYGILVDTNGNLFIADTYNNRVRKVDTNGIITTVAGSSSSGFSGDGGAATNAALTSPSSLAIDAYGNLLIADTGNNRVRRVDGYGVITTVTGNGSASYSGDNSAATNAGVNPSAIAMDGYGDLLIADANNSRIRQVDPYGIITTVAGTNGSGWNGDGLPAKNTALWNPFGVTVDSYGRTLVADSWNFRIRRFGQGPTLVLDAVNTTNAGNYTLIINSSFGSVTSAVATLTLLLPPAITSQPASQSIGLGSNATFSVSVAGTQPLSCLWQINGTNQAAQTNQSLGLTNVQWSDAGTYRVLVTNNYGSVTSTLATLTVGVPPAITSQSSNLIVLVGSNSVLSVQATGDGLLNYQWQFNGTNLPPIITTVAGTNGFGYSGDGGLATSAKLNLPQGVVLDPVGNLFIADYSNNRVRKVDTNGVITTVAGTATQGSGGNGGLATSATLYRPAGLCFDPAGNLYIAEAGNGDVRKVDTNGYITRVAGTGSPGYSNDGGLASASALYDVAQVAFDGSGNMYINERLHCRVRKVGTNGILTTLAGNTTGVTGGFSGDGGPATNAQLNTPYGIAVDATGNVFIADYANNRVRKVDTSGIISTVAGTGSGSYNGDNKLATSANLTPYCVTFDNWGNLFISDSNRRIRKLDTNGVITTVAGNGFPGFAGDGGAATNANFNSNWGIAFDKGGNLFIADEGNNRIRKVHFAGDATLTLTNLGTASSGNYSVVVASAFGSTAGSIANLTVLTRPILQPLKVQNGQISLVWNAVSNLSYQIQYSTNLMDTNWINLGSPITATNSSAALLDGSGTDGQRFYRVRLGP